MVADQHLDAQALQHLVHVGGLGAQRRDRRPDRGERLFEVREGGGLVLGASLRQAQVGGRGGRDRRRIGGPDARRDPGDERCGLDRPVRPGGGAAQEIGERGLELGGGRSPWPMIAEHRRPVWQV